MYENIRDNMIKYSVKNVFNTPDTQFFKNIENKDVLILQNYINKIINDVSASLILESSDINELCASNNFSPFCDYIDNFINYEEPHTELVSITDIQKNIDSIFSEEFYQIGYYKSFESMFKCSLNKEFKCEIFLNEIDFDYNNENYVTIKLLDKIIRNTFNCYRNHREETNTKFEELDKYINRVKEKWRKERDDHNTKITNSTELYQEDENNAKLLIYKKHKILLMSKLLYVFRYIEILLYIFNFQLTCIISIFYLNKISKENTFQVKEKLEKSLIKIVQNISGEEIADKIDDIDTFLNKLKKIKSDLEDKLNKGGAAIDALKVGAGEIKYTLKKGGVELEKIKDLDALHENLSQVLNNITDLEKEIITLRSQLLNTSNISDANKIYEEIQNIKNRIYKENERGKAISSNIDKTIKIIKKEERIKKIKAAELNKSEELRIQQQGLAEKAKEIADKRERALEAEKELREKKAEAQQIKLKADHDAKEAKKASEAAQHIEKMAKIAEEEAKKEKRCTRTKRSERKSRRSTKNGTKKSTRVKRGTRKE